MAVVLRLTQQDIVIHVNSFNIVFVEPKLDFISCLHEIYSWTAKFLYNLV